METIFAFINDLNNLSNEDETLAELFEELKQNGTPEQAFERAMSKYDNSREVEIVRKLKGGISAGGSLFFKAVEFWLNYFSRNNQPVVLEIVKRFKKLQFYL